MAIQLGRRYRQRGAPGFVTVKATLNRHDQDYKEGFRFLGSNGRTYREDGTYSSTRGAISDHDLIEWVDRPTE
jgi:hypothetical protein